MDSTELEIDPKLFITCRLCLEEMGVYQIVPTVQESIKYCFDITVEPFDGLPQLLCKKCNILVKEYSTTKKKFIEKQQSLKLSIETKKNIAQLPEEPQECNTPYEDTPVKLCRQQRNRLISTSSSDSKHSAKSNRKKRKFSFRNKLNNSVRDGINAYEKKFACRFCSRTYKCKKSVIKHNKGHHVSIKKNYRNILNVKCMVKLDKVDKEVNNSGLVMLRQNKILADEGGFSYYVVYDAGNDPKRSCSDSSDDEIIANTHRKRIRLNSRSSNETVFIGHSNKKSPESNNSYLSNDEVDETPKPMPADPEDQINSLSQGKDTVFINIDDSSDSNMELNNHDYEKSSSNPKIIEKTIENIISVCRNKYELRHKKNSWKDNDDKALKEQQLRHKILCVGQRIINKQSLSNCITGLLRYLEHKHLNVVWDMIPGHIASPKDYVRICPKLDSQKISMLDELGWIDPPEDHSVNKPSSVEVEMNSQQISDVSQEQPLQPMQEIQQPEMDPEGAVLYTDAFCSDDSNVKKLLNTNPVANPKQLPKKAHLNDTKPVLNRGSNMTHEPFIVNINEQIDESNTIMPVITSTTSLAENGTDGISDSKSVSEAPYATQSLENPAPRIKVKPVSELMNPNSLINMNNHKTNNFWDYNSVQNNSTTNDVETNIYVPSNLVTQIQIQSVPTDLLLPTANLLPIAKVTSESKKQDCITLDTVELPNTKTDSPLHYFRSVLLIHNLHLIEANSQFTREFICLLKFKVQFKQENKANPVTLCLSLFCSGNAFCMSIKDSNLVNIHIGKMSANWQWEIMKVYQSDVANKILQNAEKAGQLVYRNTKTFLCLLKSIRQIQ